MKENLQILSYSSGIGGSHPDTANGPTAILTSKAFSLPGQTEEFTTPNDVKGRHALPHIARSCTQLAARTQALTANMAPFITLGGDHCCAIGTWSGAAAAINPFGLIWVDAHMDSHTPESSHTGNTHGMPLATLLGYGDPQLTTIAMESAKLLPSNLFLVGIRSFETEEENLLTKLGVRIYYMQEIIERGLLTILKEIQEQLHNNTNAFGISVDLDAIDPKDAPGVSVPEPDGISGNALVDAMAIFRDDQQLAGLEIAEYNPTLDKEEKTLTIACDLVNTVYGHLGV